VFAVQIVAESFHRTWSLWLQAPILLAVVALTARPLWGALREIAWSRVALVLAVAAPLLVATLLPQREYHFAGHEGAYGELLDGALPETGDLSGHRTFAVPAGVAWAMGRVVPGEVGRVLWLVGNRASLALVVLLLCACAARLAGEGADVQRRAMRIAAVGVLATPALLGWSATAFFVVPALAMGAAALLLGLAGRPAAALAWGSLALASRMETAPLLFAGVIAVGWPGWKEAARGRAVAGLIGALSVLAVQAFTMSQKRSELPLEDVRPDPSVLLENLANLTLGGPWLAAVVILLVAVTLGLAPRRDGIAEAAVAIAAVIAVVQPIFLVDVGARHLLPAAALLPLLAAAAAGRIPAGARLAWLGPAALMVVVVALAAGGTRSLAERYMMGFDVYPATWTEAADAGFAGPAGEVLDDACYVVVPEGRQAWRGSRDTMDVREIHRAALAARAGWCVQWALQGDAEFSGDTRAERLDRAVRTLRLEPVGWVEPAPSGEGRWMVLQAP